MSSAGRKLLSSVVYSQDVQGFIGLNLFPEMFKDSENVLYSFITNHLLAYGVIPSPDTIEEKVGDVLVEAPEPLDFYLGELERRFLQTQLKKIVVDATNLLNEQNPDKAFDVMLGQISELNISRKRNTLLDFRDVAETIKDEYLKQKLMDESYGMLFGWGSLDEMTGGLRGGDVCSIVGRPASGKTFMGLAVSHHNWRTGGVPLFLSMEMSNVAIAQRLAAMDTHKALSHLLKGMLTTKSYTSMMKLLEKNKTVDRPFWMMDGNLAATIDDLVMLCRQINPSSVFIDGAYLLRHPNPKASRWDRITENAEWIKQKVATDLKLPVVCSYQFSREVSKKKKNKSTADDSAGLEDIYGSDAIGQLSSVVLGLFEEDSVETLKRRRIDILKGRNGETGKFIINWDFNQMDFSEVPTKKDEHGNVVESTEELQFID